MGVKWTDRERDLGHKDYAAIRALVVSGGCYTDSIETKKGE
jgi:hypothetical protein